MDKNVLFYRFVVGLFILLILYGTGAFIVVLFGNPSLALKMLTGFSSMFAGILGFGTGYLLGRGNGSE